MGQWASGQFNHKLAVTMPGNANHGSDITLHTLPGSAIVLCNCGIQQFCNEKQPAWMMDRKIYRVGGVKKAYVVRCNTKAVKYIINVCDISVCGKCIIYHPCIPALSLASRTMCINSSSGVARNVSFISERSKASAITRSTRTVMFAQPCSI